MKREGTPEELREHLERLGVDRSIKVVTPNKDPKLISESILESRGTSSSHCRVVDPIDGSDFRAWDSVSRESHLTFSLKRPTEPDVVYIGHVSREYNAHFDVLRLRYVYETRRSPVNGHWYITRYLSPKEHDSNRLFQYLYAVVAYNSERFGQKVVAVDDRESWLLENTAYVERAIRQGSENWEKPIE